MVDVVYGDEQHPSKERKSDDMDRRQEVNSGR
jgi:hypothetical protein